MSDPEDELEGLNERQQRFVRAFMGEAEGNATKAARMAGYTGSPTTMRQSGSRLLRHPIISTYISRNDGERYACAKERREFFINMMDNEDVPHRDRIRAAEILCKMRGDFNDTVNNFAIIANADAGTIEAIARKILTESSEGHPDIWEGQLEDDK